MKTLIFDLETWPNDQEIEEWMPPVESFDPNTVRYGNIKDADKIAAKIESAREKHDGDAHAEQDAFRDKATLRPHLCRIFAVGYGEGSVTDDKFHYSFQSALAPDDKAETTIIEGCWDMIEGASVTANWNLFGFDLPLLIHRSRILGVRVPAWIRTPLYRNDRLIDLMDTWNLNRAMSIPSKLDDAARILGVEGKLQLPDGQLPWQNANEGGEEWMKYLHQDIVTTWEVGKRINALP